MELFPGRSPELKAKLAREFTEALERSAGIKPEATTVVFVDIPAHDWIVAGKPLSAGLQSK